MRISPRSSPAAVRWSDDVVPTSAISADEKNEAAEAAAEAGPRNPRLSEVAGDQEDLMDSGTIQDTSDVRKKSSGRGQVTADKWNQ